MEDPSTWREVVMKMEVGCGSASLYEQSCEMKILLDGCKPPRKRLVGILTEFNDKYEGAYTVKDMRMRIGVNSEQ